MNRLWSGLFVLVFELLGFVVFVLLLWVLLSGVGYVGDWLSVLVFFLMFVFFDCVELIEIVMVVLFLVV